MTIPTGGAWSRCSGRGTGVCRSLASSWSRARGDGGAGRTGRRVPTRRSRRAPARVAVGGADRAGRGLRPPAGGGAGRGGDQESLLARLGLLRRPGGAARARAGGG